MLSVSSLRTHTPKAPLQTRPANIHFSAAISPNCEQEIQEHSRKSREILEKVYYQGENESFTGADILNAILKAGYKSLLKPTVTLNPFKWLQIGAAFVTGDGYSQWILFEAIIKNLPLSYSAYSSAEQSQINGGLFQALSEMQCYGLVRYTDSKIFPHIFNNLWRPTQYGKRLLSAHKRQQAQTHSVPLLGEVKTAQQLKTQLESQMQEIGKKQSSLEKEHQATLTQFQAEDEKRKALNAEVETLTVAMATQPELKNKLLSAQTDATLQEELCQALALKLSVSDELRLQYETETQQTTMKVKTALKRIEITRIHAETLQLSGKLKEKKAMEDQLTLQLLEAQSAYESIKTALAAENPEAFIALIRQVRLLETEPKSVAPLTLKVPAAQSLLLVKTQQHASS